MDKDIWIVDFGSQYTQLITRKCRELGHNAHIMTVDESLEKIQKESPKALILSGGPQSVFQDTTDYAPFFKNQNLPILGICYGMQILGQYFQGKVVKGEIGEYGHVNVHLAKDFSISGIQGSFSVWMSHSDHIETPPNDFEVVIESDNGLVAGIKHKTRPIMGLQFHPEVHHTDRGVEILDFFLNSAACLKKDWDKDQIYNLALDEVKSVGDAYVLCAFSGGVDSLVAASLAQQSLGDKLYCFFVDNGLLRPQDYHHIEVLQKETPLNIIVLHEAETFLSKLAGVADPEEKRKIIGRTFIEVFEKKVHEFETNHGIKFEYLLQGTLYPDVIESISPHKKGGKSVTIKSHHNVGGLPERMKLKLLEPLKYLFKDEVRIIGEKLQLVHDWVHRHPFPGPGIGVRVLGEITSERVKKVQHSDQIFFEELKAQGQYDRCWQAFTVLLPVKTVGVKGDSRAYEEVIALRVVNSVDGMTATWTDFPFAFLSKVSSRICNEVQGITRVVYDITSKPPGTIEWE